MSSRVFSVDIQNSSSIMLTNDNEYESILIFHDDNSISANSDRLSLCVCYEHSQWTIDSLSFSVPIKITMLSNCNIMDVELIFNEPSVIKIGLCDVPDDFPINAKTKEATKLIFLFHLLFTMGEQYYYDVIDAISTGKVLRNSATGKYLLQRVAEMLEGFNAGVMVNDMSSNAKNHLKNLLRIINKSLCLISGVNLFRSFI